MKFKSRNTYFAYSNYMFTKMLFLNIDVFVFCSDLKEAIRCIHGFSRHCMHYDQRKHFQKLFRGTGQMVHELCRMGPYQEGKQFLNIINVIKHILLRIIWQQSFLWNLKTKLRNNTAHFSIKPAFCFLHQTFTFMHICLFYDVHLKQYF